ncbi:MAG: hypothetical protein E4G96_01320, partial [Chrysiogenales bacterium]
LDRPKPPEGNRVLASIYERMYGEYTPFHFLEESAAAAVSGLPIPDYLTYHSYYYAPGLGRRIPGIQSDYLAVNFRDASECARSRGMNMVVMKASYRDGKFNCGTNVDIMLRAIIDVKKQGGVVILLENENMPYSCGNADIPIGCVDYVVRDDEPLFIMPHQPLTVLEHAIGCHVADIVPDGATLQLGIGQMADSISFWLARRGRSGLNGYSELISPGFLYMIRKGVITRHDENNVLLTGAFIVGGEDLYRYVDGNPYVRMTEVHETNNKDRIAQLSRFHGINSTLQMDLFSQATSEGFFLEERFVQYTGMGGQFEFQESAMKSEGGKSILCLRSTLRDASGEPIMSNIVPSLRNVVGVPRNKMDYVVTEYGWRCIRFASIEERARAMIELADSTFQEGLLRAAREMGLVRAGYRVPQEFRNNTYGALVDRMGDIASEHHLPLGSGIDLKKYATADERTILDRINAGADPVAN